MVTCAYGQSPYAFVAAWHTAGASGGAGNTVLCDRGNNAIWTSSRLDSPASGHIYVEKRSTTGAVLWSRTLTNSGGAGIARVASTQLDFDDNVYLLCERYATNGNSYPEIVLIRLNKLAGDVAWERVISRGTPSRLLVNGNGSTGIIIAGGQRNHPTDSNKRGWIAGYYSTGTGTPYATFQDGNYTGGTFQDASGGGGQRYLIAYTEQNLIKVRQTNVVGTVDWASVLSSSIVPPARLLGSSIYATKVVGQAKSVYSAELDPPDGRLYGVRSYPGDGGVADVFARFSTMPTIVTSLQEAGTTSPLLHIWDAFHSVLSSTYLASYANPFVQGQLAREHDVVYHVPFTVADTPTGPNRLVIKAWNHGTYTWTWQYPDSEGVAASADLLGSLYVTGRRKVGGKWMAFLLKLSTLPIPHPDVFELDQDSSASASAGVLFANDLGFKPATVQYGSGQGGTFVGTSAGGFTYTGNQGFTGIDEIPYSLTKGGMTRSSFVRFLVQPLLADIVLATTEVTGGTSTTCTVILSGERLGSPVTIATGDGGSTATSVPNSVVIPAGSDRTTFQVLTAPVTSDRVVTIGASYKSVTVTDTLTVRAPRPSTLTATPNVVVGGSPFTGTVRLTGRAPGAGCTVTLTHSGTDVGMPISLQIAGGTQEGSFSGTTQIRTTPVTRTLTAKLNGATATCTLTLTP